MLNPARNAALLQLAVEMPAPVLADLLGGLVPATAVKWAAIGSRDWAAYVTLRANNEHR